MNRRHIVCVKWRDSCIRDEQDAEGNVPPVSVIHSVGFLVREKKRSISLTRDFMHGDIRGTITIPRECIVSIRTVKLKE